MEFEFAWRYWVQNYILTFNLKPIIIQSFGQTQKFDDIMTKVCDFYHIDSPWSKQA